MKKYVVALDQGTTSSRCIVFDKELNVVSISQKEFPQIFPKSAWVEQKPQDIYISQYSVFTEALLKAEIKPDEIAGIGIANQRETTIIWDKNTGNPVYNAIVWQCRRTSEICEELKQDGMADYIHENTGLVIDAYFSATKIKWILDNVDGAREKANNGDLLFGTVDTWLVWKLTDGKAHVTDYTNASRTMLFNIHSLEWDEYILNKLDIPKSMLPKVCKSSEVYETVNVQGIQIPICGMAGDQQSALFGQTCFNKGDIKNTYGTGCFTLMNIGNKPVITKNNLLTTIGASATDEINYVLEGSVFVGGALIQWLRDDLKFINNSKESETFANKVTDSGGVYIVPAFTGLGAPHWDMYARGTMFGITRGTTPNHIIRASLEAIAFQTKDVIDAMIDETSIKLTTLRVDGGASANNLLMQFQSDILGIELNRPIISETTALGAAFLAGLAVGFWSSLDEVKQSWKISAIYNPNMDKKLVDEKMKNWSKAVECTKLFTKYD